MVGSSSASGKRSLNQLICSRERESENEFEQPSICTSVISKSNFAITTKKLLMLIISDDFVVWAVHIVLLQSLSA